nr:MAG TPA: hypothetical protein [Caudoviricetes sp.]
MYSIVRANTVDLYYTVCLSYELYLLDREIFHIEVYLDLYFLYFFLYDVNKRFFYTPCIYYPFQL